jgi:hypothetical protein
VTQEVVSLPLYPSIDDEAVDVVVAAVRAAPGW